MEALVQRVDLEEEDNIVFILLSITSGLEQLMAWFSFTAISTVGF